MTAVDAMRKNDRTTITQVSNYADVRNSRISSRYDGVIQYYYCFITLYRGTENSIALFGNRAILLFIRPFVLHYCIMFYRYYCFIYFIPLQYIIVVVTFVVRPSKTATVPTYLRALKNKQIPGSVRLSFSSRAQHALISLKINVRANRVFGYVTYGRRITRFARFPPICMCAHR